MNWKISMACLLALTGVSSGCATTASDSSYPSASPGVISPVTTDAPRIDNADAAGPASVPGVLTGTVPAIIVPDSANASPVIIVPPAQVPPAQPR